MKLWKLFAVGTVLTLLTALLAVPASAHGGRHHAARRTTPSYAVCSVEQCTETGRHDHDGVTYCGYSHTGGYCTGSACTSTTGGHHRGHC